ncbi:MAG: glucokinase, partial [Oceanicoccus sp.]
MIKPVQIVADIGGTNARFAYVHSDSNTLLAIEVFPCADFPFLIDAVRAYMAKQQLESVEKICLAIAGPVGNDHIDIVNNHWAFSCSELQQALGLPVTIINDFTAQVLSTASFTEAELQWVGKPRPLGQQVTAVVGPGTGLGVSAMLPSGDILPSEGGHVAFAATNEHEAKLLNMLWQRYPRVSVERVLSGMGLANLYWANCMIDGYDRELSAPEVTAGAKAGDVYCLQAVKDFCDILASVAGDIGLMVGSAGGVYISGGILPRLLDFVDLAKFRQRFDDKGRFSDMCSAMPVAIVLAEYPGLKGCIQAL